MRTPLLETAIAAAVAAGNLLVDSYDDVLLVAAKESVRDIVTQVDRLAEAAAIDVLRDKSPGVPILSEEQGEVGGEVVDRGWVLDALDGTVNYVNHIPFFAVSVAFLEAGEPAVGVVYNPMTSDLYYGAEGIGVFRNQSRLHVKDASFQESLYSVAFSGKSHDPASRPGEFLLMGEINDATRGCLRTGSASMNLAYLADGRFGGCWGKANKYWDIAAGLLLAKLAGATVQSQAVDASRRLISYVAAVPSAWAALHPRVRGVLNLR